jgi:hypothetical protein
MSIISFASTIEQALAPFSHLIDSNPEHRASSS